jgi:ribonuclease HI
MIPQTEPVSTEHSVIAYGDGSCIPNPGPGGHAWCAKLPDGGLIDYQRHDPAATNNTQEMKALLSFLQWVHPDQPATYVTDSEYVTNGWNEYLPKWKGRGWRKADGKPVLNADLWKEIDALLSTRKVSIGWTKGHADSRGNLRADKLAGEAACDKDLSEGRVRAVQTW